LQAKLGPQSTLFEHETHDPSAQRSTPAPENGFPQSIAVAQGVALQTPRLAPVAFTHAGVSGVAAQSEFAAQFVFVQKPSPPQNGLTPEHWAAVAHSVLQAPPLQTWPVAHCKSSVQTAAQMLFTQYGLLSLQSVDDVQLLARHLPSTQNGAVWGHSESALHWPHLPVARKHLLEPGVTGHWTSDVHLKSAETSATQAPPTQ
jgi:hypothetical protein